MKPGFKQTEVGVIPEDWKQATLGEQFCFSGGFSASRAQLGSSGHCYLHYGDIHTSMRPYVNVSAEYADIPKLDIPLARISPKSILRDGDVVFVDASEDDEGTSKHRLVINPDNIPYISGLHTIVAKAKNDCLLAKSFRQYCFQSRYIKDQFLFYSTGIKVTGISKPNIAKIFIVFPPTLAEQEAFASALGNADALIESLERLIAKKRNVKQGAMQELLTARRRLPGFTEKWKTKRLGDIAHIKTGSRNNEDQVEDGQYPFFVRSETVERINSYSYDCEAILVPGEGKIGSIFHYISGRFDVHQRVYAITQFKSGMFARFVHFYLSKYFGVWAMQNTVKATVDSLRLPTFQTFEMNIPSTLAEQTAIAAVLSDMDAEIAALEAKLAKARAIKQGMMQELLTGRIRLK